MNVTSISFIGFAVLVALLHGIWRARPWRALLMLVANIAFVLSFTTEPRALLPYVGFLAWGYFCVRTTRYFRRMGSAVAFIGGTLALFVWLKKYWFVSMVASFLPFPYLTVGLSYTFFRVLGLVIDARQNPHLAAVGPVRFFNFAMNFPTFVAGPIDRYQDFYKPAEPVDAAVIGHAFYRIAWGFFKIIVLSQIFGGLQTEASGALNDVTAASHPALWGALCVAAYPLQLFFNSSGYADIVIGIGRLFGKRYPENFDRPFLAYTFIEFWSRYHMSLSNWLKDYVYTPLLTVLMRRFESPALDPWLGAVAYFVTFFLIGIWHGSTPTFAIYGLLLGAGVSTNKLYQVYLGKRLGKKKYRALGAVPAYRIGARGLTYAWYSFCMIFFWGDQAQVLDLFSRLGWSGMLLATLAIWAASAVVLEVADRLLASISRADAVPASAWPYVRAVFVSSMITACFAYVVTTAKVNPTVIYQAF